LSKVKINGVLLLDKPLGLSSNTALQKAKRIYNAAKAGHTGTLDPLATGLLPICFGEATKFSSGLLNSNKEYIATIKLGSATTTYDAEGDIVSTNPVNCTEYDIQTCLKDFLGKITQVPPIYSALKVNGKALYEYARSNQEVEIKSREVEIFDLELLNIDGSTCVIPEHGNSYPGIHNDKYKSEDFSPAMQIPKSKIIIQFKLRVLCSKGTYIRSLAHDIGQMLGCGAHLSGLIRTKTNNFSLNQAITLDELACLSPEKLQNKLLPVDILVEHLPKHDLTDEQFSKVKHGHGFAYLPSCEYDSQTIRLYYKQSFLGLGVANKNQVDILRLINNVGLLINTITVENDHAINQIIQDFAGF
jgi:tRNA pseudouridine55 synthase